MDYNQLILSIRDKNSSNELYGELFNNVNADFKNDPIYCGYISKFPVSPAQYLSISKSSAIDPFELVKLWASSSWYLIENAYGYTLKKGEPFVEIYDAVKSLGIMNRMSEGELNILAEELLKITILYVYDIIREPENYWVLQLRRDHWQRLSYDFCADIFCGGTFTSIKPLSDFSDIIDDDYLAS